jgi:hypothetical protein
MHFSEYFSDRDRISLRTLLISCLIFENQNKFSRKNVKFGLYALVVSSQLSDVRGSLQLLQVLSFELFNLLLHFDLVRLPHGIKS